MKWKIISFLLVAAICCQAQYKNTFPTPNASSLGLFGEISVDYFNGLPQIDIPLYEFKSKDLSIPISLSYHASNIKPSDHASWVGLGWSLQSGGLITRVVNDLPDEFIMYDYIGTGANIGREKKGFFFNYSLLGNANWTSTTLTDEVNLLFAGGVLDYTTYNNLLYRADKAPDEFQFNFLGMSGSLFMGQDGLWKLKSKQGLNLKVSIEMGQYNIVELTSYPFSTPGSIVKNCIKKIILTGSDGVQYTFGGTPESIEFIRNGIGQPNTGIPAARDGGTIPTSWYLTNIKSVSNDKIDLVYTRDGYQIHNTPGGMASTYACPTCTPSLNYSNGSGSTQGDNLVILDGVTLSSITGANGSIQFNKSKAKILDYSINDINNIPASTVQLFEAYGYEVFNGGISSGAASIPSTKSTFMQLNNIFIKDNNNSIIKSVAFTYNTGENVTQINNRLFLNSVVTKGSDDVAAAPYNFTYSNMNALAGVPYETNKTDHWGYFNGVDPLTGLIFQPSGILYGSVNYTFINSGTGYLANIFNTAFKNIYTSNRNPVEVSAKSALLTSIKYPTGGITNFIWEPNTYSKYISQVPVGTLPNISVANAGNSITGPGLRIKQINSQAVPGSTVLTKNYSYYQDYINHTDYNSTGILNSSQPNYFDSYSSAGNFYYQVWSNNNRAQMHYTNGSPITYTKVQEINSDGSFIVYNYSNHDNGYIDKQPAAGFFSDYGNAALQEFHTNSMELERGLLLDKSLYSQTFKLLERTTNFYNDDVNRFNINVKRFLFENKFTLNGTIVNWQAARTGANPFQPGGPAFLGANEYALSIYTHFPFLKSQTSILYSQDGTNPLTITKAYTYDSYRNRKTETVTSSKAEQLITSYKYSPDDIVGLSTLSQAGKTAMLLANITAPVLEKTVTRASLEIEHTRTDYQQYENENKFISPLNSYRSINANPLEIDVQFMNFDSKGNISEYVNRDGVPVSLEFGYNQTYPVASVVNAENTYKSVIVNTPGTKNLSAGLSTGSNGAYATLSTTISQASVGTITFALSGGVPAGATLNVSYTLTGPANRSGSLCYGGSGTSCSPPNSGTSVTLTAMPIGTYTLSATVSTSFTSFPLGITFGYTYQGITTTVSNTGIKEFFYEGFEEQTSSSTVSPYAGKKCYFGDYTTTFIKPNAKIYKVNYHYREAGTVNWKNITKDYINGIVLSEGDAIDEIRIYPADAYMTTYTYTPLIGMSSNTDANGKTTFYEYDAQNRLSLIRDQDKNILKKICYNFAGQQENCSLSVAANWVATGTLRCATSGGVNTGYQEREERDNNANSPTYNQTQWLYNGYNTSACPLPAVPCSFTTGSGFGLITSGISSSAGVASFYIVFYPTGPMNPGNSYQVATVNGGCKPSTTRTISYSSGGRNWSITIYPSGQMYWYLLPGSTSVSANSTIGTSTLTYNL